VPGKLARRGAPVTSKHVTALFEVPKSSPMPPGLIRIKPYTCWPSAVFRHLERQNLKEATNGLYQSARHIQTYEKFEG
jgi:hypothetical protein